MIMNLTTSLTQDMIESQLERVIASRHFCNAPRLSRFLSYLVEECLAGRVDRVKGYSIGLEVFDKTDDFDPQTDTIVRVQARALRRKLSQYYAQEGAQDPVHISIPKGSYEPIFEPFGAIQELTQSAIPSGAQPSIRPSIAVLPFDDLSEDSDQGFMAQGLTEAIITDLSRFKQLLVFSRATTQQAKAEGLSVSQMRNSFRPDFILEGSLRVDGETTNVTIDLVDAQRDNVIFVDHFQSPTTLSALYEIQDKIAQQIAWCLSDSWGPIGQVAAQAKRKGQSTKWDTVDWIYQYYRKGLELDQAERIEIRAGLERAILQDPYSSAAHAVLAFLWLDEYRLETGDVAADILDLALKSAQTAIECDNQSAMAFCALARSQFHLGDFEGFRRSADQALELNPGHADMLAMLGMCFMVRGDEERALPLLDMALLLNPLHPAWYRLIRAYTLMLTDGEPEAALAEMRINPLPEKYFYTCHLIWMLVESGDMDEALREKEALLERFPDFEGFIAHHYRVSGVEPKLAERVFAAWRMVGLKIAE